MTEREKLIRLIEECGDIVLSQHIPLTADKIADYLISHGVKLKSNSGR